jgi:O-methyltransferase involved in polyketide biosynthesis
MDEFAREGATSFRAVFPYRRIRSITGLLLCLGCGNAVGLGLPSKTSIWTATSRAIGAKNPDAKLRNPDYLAIRFLGPRERAIIAADYPMEALDLEFDAAMKRLPTDQDRGFVTAQFVRTKFFDEVLEQAITDGAQ